MSDLIVKNISKVFPGNIQAIANVSFETKTGEFVTLVGPSGCGKSTLLRMIAGLEGVSSGEIYIEGKLVNDIPAKDRDVAMVFQNYALYPHMTVYQNLAFGLKVRRFPQSEIDCRVREAAEMLHLTELLHRKPNVLSGGQRQRVAVGRAIVRQPKLFLLDEPLSNLDANLRATMRTELIKLHKRLATTMIYVTHDQVEAMCMADRLIVLKDGKVQQVGVPLEVYDYPINQFVASFIGSPSMNFIECSILEENAQFFLVEDEFRIKLPDKKKRVFNQAQIQNKKIILGIRPQDILVRQLYDKSTDQDVLVAKVEFLESTGSEDFVTCLLAGQEIIVRLISRVDLQSGDRIELALNLEHARLFDPVTGQAIT